jgi:hypothetical protein
VRAIRCLVLAALVVRCVADGAPAVAQSMWTRIWENTQLRQNTNVKRDIAKPAFVTFTLPKDGPNTYQIGLGVLAPVVSTTLFEVDTLLDYQRNNAVDAAQNVLKAGTAGEWQWRAMGTHEAHNSGLLAFRGDFKDDARKKSKGWQTAIGYTHVFEGPRVFPHPDDVFPLGNALDLVYFPYGKSRLRCIPYRCSRAGE